MPEGIGIDRAASLAPDASTGGSELLFSHVVCRDANQDVYRLTDG